MIKHKLPKNWIVLNSNKHPGKVYYFNTKTNQSSWEKPTTEETGQVMKSDECPIKRKRKKSSVAEQNDLENEIADRKKLVARRSFKSVEKLVEKLVEKPAEIKETPQMKAIREKMLMKKEKETKALKLSKSSTKSLSPQTKTVTSQSPKKESAGNATATCTPQMKVVLEKMSARKSIGNVQKDQSNKNNNNKGQKNVPSKPQLKKKELNKSKEKASEQCSTTSTSRKRNRKSLKKNLGKERMENLRNSLTLENSITENSKVIPSPTSQTKDVKLLNINKNVKISLTRLEDKVPNVVPLPKEKPRIISVKNVTTVNDLVKKSLNQVESPYYEEMDWEPMEDEKITFEVQAVRSQLCTGEKADLSYNVPDHNLSSPPVLDHQKFLYIVVDTNVYLSNLDAIKLAKETVLKTFDRVCIVIPWTVIRELDYIKNNKTTKSSALSAKARKAINYINELFSSKCPFVIGQTREDAERNKEKFIIDCPDDEILQTCLQIREQDKSVVLMSYDVNFCNKAMIYDITTVGRNDPIEKVDYLNAISVGNNSYSSPNNESKGRPSLELISSRNQVHLPAHEIFEDAKNVIKDFLTVIVSGEMCQLYGDSWEKYVIKRPPWTIVSVIQCALKHWIAAVSESFLRRAEAALKDLLQVFQDVSGDISLKQVSNILSKCSDLIQMANEDKHFDLMHRASERIIELKQKCRGLEKHEIAEKLVNAIGCENDPVERQRRGIKAFEYFEAAYIFARDMCGLASESVGMPCSFHYVIPNPTPSLDYVRQIQPELAANVNRLFHSLCAILEEVKNSCVDYRTLNNLHQTLVTFHPELVPATVKLPNNNLTPLDVYCCVQEKEEVLKLGLRQLQELSTHFFRLASYKCT